MFKGICILINYNINNTIIVNEMYEYAFINNALIKMLIYVPCKIL